MRANLRDFSTCEGLGQLEPDFCNRPVKAITMYDDDYKTEVAIVYLCGQYDGHDGECNPRSADVPE